jgi:hypothetical protein
LEISRPVDQLPPDQPPHPALRLLAARQDLFRGQGSVVATWRRRGGKTFGPYYRLSYREDGRQCSVYLGRAGALVKQVRRALQSLQQSIAEFRLFERLRQQACASLRLSKLRVHALLRPFGLRLKGFEVRGWRISPLRGLLSRGKRWLPRLTLSKRGKPHESRESPASRMARYLAARVGPACRAGFRPPIPAPFTNLQHALAQIREGRFAGP